MEDITQLSTQMAMLERQIEALNQNMKMMQSHLHELLVTKETLTNIKDAKTGQEVLFPIGGGCFAFGKIVQSNQVIVNIGSNIAVKESTDKGIVSVESRIEDIKKLMAQTSASYSEVKKRMEELDARGHKMMQQQEKPKVK
ncbi:MAG: prefoldin subunit alpha [Candidatus Methanofastidiosia archaeon]